MQIFFLLPVYIICLQRPPRHVVHRCQSANTSSTIWTPATHPPNMIFTKIVSISLLSTAFALPATLSTHHNANIALTERDSCVDTCGSTCYYQSDIDAALNEGYSLYQSGDTLGSDNYPHQYNDYEGFNLPVSGPWYEFPIMNSNQIYSGGSPGPDRVLFNSGGEYTGLITHTGASGNDFDQCAVE